ncbi:hypothetical protein R1flu_026220 [Riccia fluitans]|uniref:PGG domain-containing protein n=1 Tax=Riccia fluitans TaxID=41844 RepID=A0ABD1XFC2_9MARC
MQGAGTNVSSSTFKSLPGLRKRLLQVVGDKDQTRQIVTEYPLSEIPHNEYIDTEPQLNILHWVAMVGDLDSVKELKSLGRADPTARTVGGFTAVHLGASRGHTKVVKELVSWLQSNTEAGVSDQGFTPLHLAAYGGYSETVKFLLKPYCHYVSDVNAKDQIFGRSALHFAVLAGRGIIVKMLMGVDGINIRLKDGVRKLTPLLLAAMHPKDKDGSRLRMVKMLLDKYGQQINDKVGVFTDVRQSFTESLRKLTLIEFDNSVKPLPNVQDKADKSEDDAYRRCAVPMVGHSALHLAATQNNAKLVSELCCRPGISLNIPDRRFGMTPLHCAIRVGAMQTFKALMAIDGVNVNAQLVKEGRCQLPSCNWIPPRSSFVTKERAKDRLFGFFERFDRLETPLHLAVHVCRAEDLSEMVLSFCSHPNFNGAVHNGYRKTSLELVWERLGYCGKLPSVLTVRRKESQDPQVRVVEKYLYEDKVHLNNAIDLLKRHPTNACVLAKKEGIHKAALDSVNAFLVTATLLAGLTFSAYLQPPIGTHDEEHTRKPVKLFWVFNSLSFFFAVYTILTSLFHSIHDHSNEIIFSQRDLVQLGIVRIQGAVPLTLSVGFGIMAFVAAGYANVPSDSKQLMTTCTIGGLLLVLSQLLQNLFHSFLQLRESYSLHDPSYRQKPKYTLEDDRYLFLTATFGPVLFFRLRILRILELCSQGNKIRTQIGSEVERISLMSSPIPHMCIAAAVILYALVEDLEVL